MSERGGDWQTLKTRQFGGKDLRLKLSGLASNDTLVNIIVKERSDLRSGLWTDGNLVLYNCEIATPAKECRATQQAAVQ